MRGDILCRRRAAARRRARRTRRALAQPRPEKSRIATYVQVKLDTLGGAVTRRAERAAAPAQHLPRDAAGSRGNRARGYGPAACGSTCCSTRDRHPPRTAAPTK